MRKLIEKRKKVNVSKSLDLYPLSLCCLMLLADKDKVFFDSLTAEEPLSDNQRCQLIKDEQYICKEVVLGMMNNDVSAEEAALKLNKILLTEFEAFD